MKRPRRFGNQLRELIKAFATGKVFSGALLSLIVLAIVLVAILVVVFFVLEKAT